MKGGFSLLLPAVEEIFLRMSQNSFLPRREKLSTRPELEVSTGLKYNHTSWTTQIWVFLIQQIVMVEMLCIVITSNPIGRASVSKLMKFMNVLLGSSTFLQYQRIRK